MSECDDYARRLAAGCCPVCRPDRRCHGSSGAQRQCPACRRKWSFGKLRTGWAILSAFARSLPERRAAAEVGVTGPTVRKDYGAFRTGLVEEQTSRLRQQLLPPHGPSASPQAGRVAEVLGLQAAYCGARGEVPAGLVAVAVAGGVVFVPPERENLLREDLAALDHPAAVAFPVDLREWPMPGLGRSWETWQVWKAVRRKRAVPAAGRPAHLVEAAMRRRLPSDQLVAVLFGRVVRPGLVRPRAAGRDRGRVVGGD